jgi:hypothetical protein
MRERKMAWKVAESDYNIVLKIDEIFYCLVSRCILLPTTQTP